MVVHRSVEFEGLRFDSSWGLRILFIVPRSCQDEKHISLRSQSALENLSFTPPKCVYIYEPWWKRIAIQHCVLFRYDLTSTRFVASLPLPSFSAMWRHIAINLFQRLQKTNFIPILQRNKDRCTKLLMLRWMTLIISASGAASFSYNTRVVVFFLIPSILEFIFALPRNSFWRLTTTHARSPSCRNTGSSPRHITYQWSMG